MGVREVIMKDINIVIWLLMQTSILILFTVYYIYKKKKEREYKINQWLSSHQCRIEKIKLKNKI